ncbi:unnamed protein product [Agarophyton chilense]
MNTFLTTTPLKMYSFLILLSIGASFIHLTCAHQAIAYPWPISNDGACRVGKFKNCAGPCPSRDLRLDQTPDSPSITIRRGQSVLINIMRNNHAGGFARWTLVNVKHMYNKKEHEKGAFYYTCGDQRITYCNSNNKRRDCNYDVSNRYYRHQIPVPEIYADGVYVLGYAWYGGTQGHGESGDFGDYYDCMYVEVKGGPNKQWHQPTFDMGQSATGSKGLCKTRTTWLGDCWKEPCTHRKKSRATVPSQFSNGRKPNKIWRSSFQKPYKLAKPGKTAPNVYGVSIRSVDRPGEVYASSLSGSIRTFKSTSHIRITATCDVSGSVRHVIFYRNGVPVRKVAQAPYSIAGALWSRTKGKAVWKLRPWTPPVLGKDFYSLSCVVYGKDGSVQYAKMDVQQS